MVRVSGEFALSEFSSVGFSCTNHTCTWVMTCDQCVNCPHLLLRRDLVEIRFHLTGCNRLFYFSWNGTSPLSPFRRHPTVFITLPVCPARRNIAEYWKSCFWHNKHKKIYQFLAHFFSFHVISHMSIPPTLEKLTQMIEWKTNDNFASRAFAGNNFANSATI